MSVYTANVMGILALLFWSMNVAVTRHIGEAHPFAAPGLSFTVSGLLLIAFDCVRRRPLPWKSDAARPFWICCGSAFVAYVLLYTLGLSYSSSRLVVLPLGLINYFWPSLILVLMPLFFPCRIRWGVLAAGTALCIAGVGCSLLWGVSLRELAAVAAEIWPACLMMLAAAFLWAFYSDAVRKWGGTANGVGWFQLCGGLCFLALWRVKGGDMGLNWGMAVPLLLHALVVNAAAYMLWDLGVRRGDIGLMGTLANFLPLASILFGSWYLGDATTPGLWIGAALVTLGAVLCRKGVREDATDGGVSP